MKQFLVKQRFTFGGEKFNIQDNFGQLAYQVKGSFLEIPKRFTVTNDQGIEICQITKKYFLSCLSLQLIWLMAILSIYKRN